MSTEAPTWPQEQLELNDAARWVAAACGRPAGPPEILQVKRWGVTARFGDVVLKASFTPLFPQVVELHAVLARVVPAAAPALLASKSVDGQLWTLFEHLPGSTAEEVGGAEALVVMARELGRVQGAVADQDLSALPAIDVRGLPCLLLEDVSDQPVELVEWLRESQPALQADAELLATIPRSLDHPDVNRTNAILTSDDRAVLIDWEEATVGCPLFSLERVLDDVGDTDEGTVARVIDAYLAALPWGGRDELAAALRLVPLKLAVEARSFARGLRLSNPHTKYTSRLLEQARERSAG